MRLPSSTSSACFSAASRFLPAADSARLPNRLFPLVTGAFPPPRFNHATRQLSLSPWNSQNVLIRRANIVFIRSMSRRKDILPKIRSRLAGSQRKGPEDRASSGRCSGYRGKRWMPGRSSPTSTPAGFPSKPASPAICCARIFSGRRQTRRRNSRLFFSAGRTLPPAGGKKATAPLGFLFLHGGLD